MKYSFFLMAMFFSCSTMLNGQCYPDRHSTNWFDGWVSCDAFPNPNIDRGLSHWIMYDLGQNYDLKGTRIWNTNDPSHLDRGLKDVHIDFSTTGGDWSNAGTFTFARADGSSTYEGFDGPDLTGVRARYILITAVDNWGGDCFGLSEIRFEAEDAAVTEVAELNEVDGSPCFSLSTYPNPFTTKSRLIVQSNCESKINFRVFDVLGRLIDEGSIGGSKGFHTMQINGENMQPGNYIVSVDQGGQILQQHLVKIE